MKNVYSLVKFWVLIKVAHIRLKNIRNLGSISEEQEKLKNFLLGIIDRISDFLITSHSVKLYKVCRKFSEACGINSLFLEAFLLSLKKHINVLKSKFIAFQKVLLYLLVYTHICTQISRKGNFISVLL